jgi:ABC-type transport system involved in multi-copper enzyme maturation permease subunit
MPIYEQTYRRHQERAPLRKTRFWPITREALRLLLSRKIFGLMMAAIWVPLIGFALYIYFVSQSADVRRLAPLDGSVFAQFLAVQAWLALFPTVFGGSGLIANDLRTGAILVYLSRPLTQRDYILGKLGVLLALNLSVTLAPGLALYGIAVAVAPEIMLQWDKAWLGVAVVVQSIVVSLVLSLTALALSALSRSARVAGLSFFGLIAALGPIVLIVGSITDTPAVLLLSVMDDLTSLGDALFGVQAPGNRLAWPYPAAVLLASALACLVLLRARVRAVEVVK